MSTSEERFDEIFSTSLKNYRNTLADQIFDALPLFDVMNKSSKASNGERGGLVFEDNSNDIVVPLIYGRNTTVKSYSGYDVFDNTPPTGIGNAVYPMKQVYGILSIDRFSERRNAGTAQIIKLFEARMTQLENSFKEKISEMLFGDGSGNDGKDIDGLQKLVADNPSTGVVGQIDRAEASWWRNYSDNGAHTSTSYDNLIDDMRTMYLNLCIKKTTPNFGVCPLEIYSAFEKKLLSEIKYNIGSSNLLRDANYGFENYKFHNVVLTFDNDCPAGHLYFLNTTFLTFNVDKETYFVNMPFKREHFQDVSSAQILLYGNLTCSNCRAQGVLHSIT